MSAASGPWTRRRFRLALGAIFVLALAVRLLAASRFVGLASPPDLNAQPDQLDYEEAAYHLASGDGYALSTGPTYLRAPGTSAAIAAAYLVAGRCYSAARIWFAFLSALTCVVLGFLATQLFGRSTGLLAAGLLAVTPAHWYYALHLVSELPYALAITAAVAMTLATWRAEQGAVRWWGAIGSGVLYAAAAMVRPQAGFALPLAWSMLLLAGPEVRRRASTYLLAATLAFAAIGGAWTARNARVVGRPSFAGLGAVALWGANNERALADPSLCGSWVSLRELLPSAGIARPADEGRLAELSWRQARQFLRAHARELPRLEVCKLRRLGELFVDTPNTPARIAFAAAWLFTGPLALIGLLVAWRQDRGATGVALLPLLALVLAVLVFYGSIRFRHSTEPILVLFAARGCTALLGVARRSDGGHRTRCKGVVTSKQA